MRIEVVGKHLDITPPIREYAESKAGKLLRYLDLTQRISVVLEQVKVEFHVELVAEVEGHKDIVANSHGTDLYGCIDLAVEKAARQLTDYKEMLKHSKH